MNKPISTPSEREQIKISTDPISPNSAKLYMNGQVHSHIRVPFIEITLTPTPTKSEDGGPDKLTPNDPVLVYDTSGPYTDPKVEIDVRKGLPPLRQQWIIDRGDVEAGLMVEAGIGHILPVEAGDRGGNGDDGGPAGDLLGDHVEPVSLNGQVGLQDRGHQIAQAFGPLGGPQYVVVDVLVVRRHRLIAGM